MRRRFSIFAYLAAFLSVTVTLSANAKQATSQSEVGTSTSYKKNSRYRIMWNAGIGYSSFQSLTDSENISNANLGFIGQLKLLPTLFIRSKASFRYESGNSQSLYRELDQNNGLIMREAYLDFKPNNYLRLQAGAISQKHLKAPLLVSNRAFPAALAKAGYQIGNFGLIFKAQQAIPTSQSFDEERSEMEPSPSFTTQTISAMTGFGPLKVSAYATQFSYKNIPSKVAYESSLFGNTIPDDNPGNSQFVFEYSGQTFGLEGTVDLSQSIILTAGIQSIENSNAPIGFNQGRHGYIESEIRIGNDLLIPRYQLFFNESDSSIAYYNSAMLGHNNRQGYGLGLEYHFNEHQFKIKGVYMNTDVINSRALESEEQSVLLKLETFFEDV